MPAHPPVLCGADCPACPPADGGCISGNHNFRNFIGFMSNPLQNIDPRALTAIYPLFGAAWLSVEPPLPNSDMQVYGPAMTVALSEDLAVGLNQGGYAVIHLHKNQLGDPRLGVIRSKLGEFRTLDFVGGRDGFLNLGGFVQYTLIQDVECQFLLTGGLRWEAPAGSTEVFQGHGPLHLAPYLTAGKEFGEFHVLATAGYDFPAGPGKDNNHVFYANIHFDRRLFGWLYPLIEFNTLYQEKSLSNSVGLVTRRGFVDLDNFESTGNIVTMAVGANAVLIPERLEVGAVYSTSIATQGGFNVNGLLVKIMLRF
jgi:hypothetical protein